MTVLGLTQGQAYKFYGIVGTLGPISGVLFAGFSFDKIGGYMGPLAIPLVGLMGFVGMLAGIGSVLFDNPYFTAACLTLQLFCGGFIMPACTGIMLNQVPKDMRTIANSVANLCYNLFGYLPAPTIYGVVYEIAGGG